MQNLTEFLFSHNVTLDLSAYYPKFRYIVHKYLYYKYPKNKKLIQSAIRYYRKLDFMGATMYDITLEEYYNFLESIMSEKVNNPKSRFYIYG